MKINKDKNRKYFIFFEMFFVTTSNYVKRHFFKNLYFSG